MGTLEATACHPPPPPNHLSCGALRKSLNPPSRVHGVLHGGCLLLLRDGEPISMFNANVTLKFL